MTDTTEINRPKAMRFGPVHINPQIDFGEILQVLALVGALGVFLLNTERRMTALEVTQNLEGRHTAETLTDIKSALIRIEESIKEKADK